MKTFKKIHFRKGWWKSLLAAILCIGVVVGAGFGIASLVRPDKVDDLVTYRSLSSTKYGIGGLDSNGNYMNTDQSIYTKDAFECQGLNCTLDFDNEISYQVYFYDQNNEFVHTTGKLSGAFVQESVPFFAKYARIVIIPNDDNKVSLIEVAKYAKQLKVEMYREQGFKNYTENMFSVYKTDCSLSSDGAETVLDGNVVTDYINVTPYKKSLVVRLIAQSPSTTTIFLYDSQRNFIKKLESTSTFNSSEGYVYYNLDLTNVEDLTYVRLTCGGTIHCELYFA